MAENAPDAVLPDPRYELRAAGRLAVRVERAAGLPPVEAGVKLVDISREGVKLLASSRLHIHETVTIRIEVPEVRRDFSLPARVCWSHPAKGESWRLGCTFTQDLHEDVLDQLAVLGYIERRKDPRQTVDAEAWAVWELAEQGFPVRIVSLSPGGFCICCPQAGKIGARLLLEFGNGEDRPVRIHGRAVWQATADGYCLMGCALASRGDYELLCSSVKPALDSRPFGRTWNMPSRSKAETGSARSRPALKLAAVAVGVLVVLLVALLGVCCLLQ
jgi:hypothetical protein